MQRRRHWAEATRAALREQRLRPDTPAPPADRRRREQADDWQDDRDPLVRAVRFAHLRAMYD